jgi:GxxExxY protein
LSHKIFGLPIDVHTTLGPGLPEGAYKECQNYKIINSGLFAEKEKPLPLIFEEVRMECGYRIDLLVEKKLVLEIKSVETLNDWHLARVLTYLRVGDFRPGLLVNFNTVRLKEGIKRVINGRIY